MSESVLPRCAHCAHILFWTSDMLRGRHTICTMVRPIVG